MTFKDYHNLYEKTLNVKGDIIEIEKLDAAVVKIMDNIKNYLNDVLFYFDTKQLNQQITKDAHEYAIISSDIDRGIRSEIRTTSGMSIKFNVKISIKPEKNTLAVCLDDKIFLYINSFLPCTSNGILLDRIKSVLIHEIKHVIQDKNVNTTNTIYNINKSHHNRHQEIDAFAYQIAYSMFKLKIDPKNITKILHRFIQIDNISNKSRKKLIKQIHQYLYKMLNN